MKFVKTIICSISLFLILIPYSSQCYQSNPDLSHISERAIDESVNVIFKAPPAHIENPSLAKIHGAVKIYELPTDDNTQSLSVMSVTFQKKANKPGLLNLKEFVATDIMYFQKQYPNAEISSANFPKDVTQHLSDLNIPFLIFFTKGNVEGPGNRYLGDSLVCFFETPDGFWSLSWSAPEEVLKNHTDSFFFFIKDMKIVLKTKGTGS